MRKMYKWHDWWHHILNEILHQVYKWRNLSQFAICTLLNIFSMLARSYRQGTIGTYQYRTPRWLGKSSILERSETMYIAMVTKMSSSYCGAPRVESSLQRIKQFWCKLAEISLFIIFDQNLVSVWHNHLANLHILKSWISLEWREIFENSKQHFPSCTTCLS